LNRVTSTDVLPQLYAKYLPGVQAATPGIVSGVPIVGSLVNFAAAALDVFVLPMRNYRENTRHDASLLHSGT